MTAEALDGVGVDAVPVAEVAQAGAQGRTHVLPAPDADVDVVPLREDPAVAAGHGAELDQREAAVPLLVDRAVRHVAFERDADRRLAAQPQRARRQPVRAVGADDYVGLDGTAVDDGSGAAFVPLDGGDLHAVAEVGPRGGSLLGQEVIEASPLGHQDQRLAAAALERPAVAKPKSHPVDDVLDDRLDGDGQLADRAHRQPAATGLVAREAGLVDEEHARAGRREPVGGGRSRRPRSDHDRVEPLHSGGC